MMTKALARPTLLEHLSRYGYSLMQPDSFLNHEEVLTHLLKQDDPRLLEGFPVVFFNMLKTKKTSRWELSKWHPGKALSAKTEDRLAVLLVLSHLLFKLFGFEKEYSPRTLKLLVKCKNGSALLDQLAEPFLKSEPVHLGTLEFSTERLKKNFRNYVVLEKDQKEARERSHQLELELLLSEMFTPKQKALLRKKLEGKELSKTEREYFYRVVKKRLKALANEDLHQLARQLVT